MSTRYNKTWDALVLERVMNKNMQYEILASPFVQYNTLDFLSTLLLQITKQFFKMNLASQHPFETDIAAPALRMRKRRERKRERAIASSLPKVIEVFCSKARNKTQIS